MTEITVKDFNKRYGTNSFGYPVYKMVSKEDIDTYVCMKIDGQTIPYFCHWVQVDAENKLPSNSNNEYNSYHKIIKRYTNELI